MYFIPMIQIRIRVNTDFMTTIPGLLYITAAGKMYKMTKYGLFRLFYTTYV